MIHNDEHILTVSALTAAIKGNLERSFPFVWVKGQVTNVARPASGHIYFTLRDADASLTAVWFKNQHGTGEQFDPLTGEVYDDGPRPSLAASLENGQEVICAGKLAVYAPRGTYQLVVEIAQEVGLGRLQAEFERLKAKLQELGYFSIDRKRPLPPHPERIAVVTSPQGAAIHDFLRIIGTRGSQSSFRIYPVSVQGDQAPPQIVAALERIGIEGWAQVVVLIRGGGSLEDLWAFNTEPVAKAIVASPIPVLTGVGHEVDTTLADLAADLRAATPTHAAQLLLPDKRELLKQLRQTTTELQRSENRYLTLQEQRLALLEKSVQWHSPQRTLQQWNERLKALSGKLTLTSQHNLENKRTALAFLQKRLHTTQQHLPLYAQHLATLAARLTASTRHNLAGKHTQLDQVVALLRRIPPHLPQKASKLQQLYDQCTATAQKRLQEKIYASERLGRQLEIVPTRMPQYQQQVTAQAKSLHILAEASLTRISHSLELASLKLEAANPLAPLSRGYALLQKENGSFVKSVSMIHTNEQLRALLHDGEIVVRVEKGNTNAS